jgi:UDP-N-acetylmuramyl pentapeptide phosphotransferase/UDP-N-acetylglucosamine-1-phosphate transferase
MGFLDDYKIKFKPEMRLLVMFLISIIIIYLLEINIHYTQIKFLDNLINFNKLTLALFVCFCVLFIVNGSNFIDGFNGLLTIQYLIILLILYLLIYDFKDLIYLKNYILLSILLSLSFLLFNFPFGKIFLGDGGAYFLGSNLSLIIIEINHFNFFTKFSPFMFACLLFYIFFEVFFSFFRKVFFNKSSPVKPDKEHFHMLLFNFINRKISNPLKSNYLTSIVINLVYFFLIFPIFFIYTSGTKCKMYFFFLIFMYLVFYVLLKKKNFFTDFYKFFSEKF